MTNIFIKNNKLYRNNEVMPLGISDWKPQISYSLNEFVKVGNKIYYSVSNNNQGNNPTFSGNWKLFNNNIKNHVLKSYDKFKIIFMPTNYTSSGTDVALTSPDNTGLLDTANNPKLIEGSSGLILNCGDLSWIGVGSPPDNVVFTNTGATGNYGKVKLSSGGTWDTSAFIVTTGMITYTFPKTVSGDTEGGSVTFPYNYSAYFTALDGTGTDIHIAQNGSVYLGDNVGDDNYLILRWDGAAGFAGGGSSISDTARVDYNTINHNEHTKELFVFTRNSVDEIKIPETFVVSESQLTITDDNAEGLIRRNILPITENILYDYSTITGTNIINHNLNLEDYFVASKNNITSTLSVRTLTKQTENSCVISAITGTASENYYFINKDNFDKYRYFNASTEGEWTSSTLKINHDIGSSDYFVWAVDNDNNKKVAIPNAYALGPRFASLDFNASYSSNLTVYFGGTSDNSTWFTGSGIQSTNYVTTDKNNNEWKVYIDASGILNTQLID
jgi:hypothetical protein